MGKNHSPEKNTQNLCLAELYGFMILLVKCLLSPDCSRADVVPGHSELPLTFQFQTPPTIVNIFGERMRHSQVCSIENRNISALMAGRAIWGHNPFGIDRISSTEGRDDTQDENGIFPPIARPEQLQ